MRRPGTILLLVVLLAWPVTPVRAATSTYADAGPNFNESRGCGAGAVGGRQPEGSRSGLLPAGEPVYGPWGAFFGRNQAQIEASLVNWEVPMSGGQTVRVHARSLPAFQQVTANLAVAAARALFYRVEDLFGWVRRTVGGRTRISHHFFGNAVDINPPRNPFQADGTLITDLPQWYVDAWTAAGFCWGGDWTTAKDPMHFSWMGPLAAAGYGPRPSPYPPMTASADFDLTAFDGSVAFGGPGDPQGEQRRYAPADRSGDSSDDLYSLRRAGGGLVVEAAGSRFDFTIVGWRVHTSLAADPDQAVLVDLDGDSRADLGIVDDANGSMTVYSNASDFEEVIGSLPVPAGSGIETAFGYYDDDWAPDLLAIRRGNPTRIEVYLAASGYRDVAAAADLAAVDSADPGSWAFAVGDYDVDGVADVYAVEKSAGARVVIARGAAGYAAATTVATGLSIGRGTSVALGDYDGDGRDDLYLLDRGRLRIQLGGVRALGEDFTSWFLPDDPWPWDAGPQCRGPRPCDQIGFVGSSARWNLKEAVASEAEDTEFFFGNPGDVPFTGDWDCDGVDTPGLYRQSDGYVYLRNDNGQGVADVRFYFGNPGDVPVAGDFNGDGCDTVSLYRADQGRFFIIDRLGSDDLGLGAAERTFLFGNPGDKPFAGDFDGNGIDDVGLHRESTGLVYYRLSHSSGPADVSFIYGDPGDRLLAGDWDGDGADTVAVFRPSDGNWYVKLANADGIADHAVHYGTSSVTPVAGWFGTPE